MSLPSHSIKPDKCILKNGAIGYYIESDDGKKRHRIRGTAETAAKAREAKAAKARARKTESVVGPIVTIKKRTSSPKRQSNVDDGMWW
jgi:hypothetical protein